MSAAPAVIEVVAPGGPPTHNALVLHGILGSGANWRSFIRRVAADLAARGWRFVLPDLRGHGDAALPAGPHDVDACARDCAALEAALGTSFDWVLGHSFGGKVACAFVRGHARAPRSLWLLDTPPTAAPLGDRGADSVVRVLAVLASMEVEAALPNPPEGAVTGEVPAAVARPRIVARLEADGVAPAVAAWLGTAVRARSDGGWGWRFDLPTVRALIADFAELDCLPWLATGGLRETRRVVVRGADSDRFPPGLIAALADPARAGWLETKLLPDAGHWLHVDNPDGLAALLLAELAAGPW